jgi:hypothetical protein
MDMSQNSVNPMNAIEMQEVIDKLKASGFSEIVDCLLDNEKDCYTKKGRLNKSSTCRKLNWKSKKLEDSLKQMKELLKLEFDIDDENQLNQNT